MNFADEVRYSFEKLMRENGRSVDREKDDSYSNSDVCNMWVAYKVGVKFGFDKATKVLKAKIDG